MPAQPRCPKCGAELRPEYVRCPFCGEWLRRTQPSPPTWPARRRRSRAPLVIGIVGGVVVLGVIAAAVVLLLTRSSARGFGVGTGIADGGMAEAELERVLQRCGFEVVDSLPETPTPSDRPRITEEGIRIIARAEEEGRTATLGRLLDGIELYVRVEGEDRPLSPDQLGQALLEAAAEVPEDGGPLAFAIARLCDEADGSGRRIGFDASSSLSPVQGVLLQVVLLSVVDEVNGQSVAARSDEGVGLTALGRWLGPSVAYAQDWDEEAAYAARAEQILKQKMAVAAAGAVAGLGLVAVSVVCPVAAPAALAGLGTVYFTVFATNAALDLQLAMEYRYHREYGVGEIGQSLREGRAPAESPVVAAIRATTVSDSVFCASDKPNTAGYLEGIVPLSVKFDGSSSRTDLGHEIAEYKWYFPGEAMTDEPERTDYGEQVEHTFYRPGASSVTLTVTDDAGQSATAVIIISTSRAADESGATPAPAADEGEREGGAAVGTDIPIPLPQPPFADSPVKSAHEGFLPKGSVPGLPEGGSWHFSVICEFSVRRGESVTWSDVSEFYERGLGELGLERSNEASTSGASFYKLDTRRSRYPRVKEFCYEQWVWVTAGGESGNVSGFTVTYVEYLLPPRQSDPGAGRTIWP